MHNSIKMCAFCAPRHLIYASGSVDRALVDKVVAEQTKTNVVSKDVVDSLAAADCVLTHGMCAAAEQRMQHQLHAMLKDPSIGRSAILARLAKLSTRQRG